MNLIDTFNIINIIQIGCGGTGSWVVPLVSKLVNNIRLRIAENQSISYILVDNDVVETRNILRQNFSEWDIGKNKAHSLVSRYIYNFEKLMCFPIQIKGKKDFAKLYNQPTNDFKSLIIILGCIDNNITRQLIYKYIKSNIKSNVSYIYIDSGNLLYNGQIITLPFGLSELDQSCLTNFKKQKKLNFNKIFPKTDTQETQESCAFFGDQSQAINSLAATLMFCCLQKILVTSELPPQIINFNSSGYSTFEV